MRRLHRLQHLKRLKQKYKIPVTFKFPRTIKIDGFPQKSFTPTNWHGFISFSIGCLLLISESMPFIDNQYNGVIHMLSKIQQEYTRNFKS